MEVTTEKEAYKALQDPFVFIEKIWGLIPQKVKKEYENLLYKCRKTGDYKEMRLDMFEICIKWKHITWQQAEIVRAINYARLWVKIPKISIASGHWIWKSTIIAMIILWYLFVHPMSKIWCTAPTKYQMYDVLWSEIQTWINKMPEFVKNKYEYTNDYIRIVESPNNWFARARTARKENPEALAGLHSDYMLILADEASGVDDAIFKSAKSALTNENTLFLMISNPTRLEWYFYDSHHKLKHIFQTMKFSSKESPVVSDNFVNEILSESSEDSDEYRYRVLWEFPMAENIDDKGFLPLYNFEVVEAKNNEFVWDIIMGIDPAGKWSDKTSIVIRDNFKAWVVAEENISTTESIAELVATILTNYDCKYIYYDNFGEWANLGGVLATMWIRAIWVNVWDPSDDEKYLNKRAMIYWRTREWLKKWWEVSRWILNELNVIKYKNNIRNKIQIMSKDDMRKRWIKSPNNADAFALTMMVDVKNDWLINKINKNNPLGMVVMREKRRKVY